MKKQKIIETKLLAMFRDLLNRENIEKSDSFFDKGGNFELSERLSELIFHKFGMRFRPITIYDNPSVDSIRKLIIDVESNFKEFDFYPAVRDTSEKSRRIVFLKQHKVGGTTFASSVLFPYCIKNKLKYMMPREGFIIGPDLIMDGDEFDMAFHHFPGYPTAKKWLNKLIDTYFLITIIREPVGRAVSAYNNICYFMNIKNVSFEEYLDRLHEPNSQSKWMGFNGKNIDRIANEFSMIGITDLFDESMLLFRSIANLDLEDVLYIPQREHDPKLIGMDNINEMHRKKIKEIDWLDMQLYDFSKKLLLENLKNISGFKEELLIYREALRDFRHPLWGKRGSFPIGMDHKYLWAKFCSHERKVKNFYRPQ